MTAKGKHQEMVQAEMEVIPSETSVPDLGKNSPEERGDVSPDVQDDVQDSQHNIPDKTPSQEKLSPFCLGWHRIRGFVFALASAIELALANYLFYYLHTDYRHLSFSPSIVLFTRFLLTLLVSLLLMPLYQYKLGEEVMADFYPLPEASQQFLVLLKLCIRGLTGTCAIISGFYALQYISPGELSTIIWSNPILVSILARILLKEPLGIFQVSAAMLAIMGVVIIARPPFLFGGEKADERLLTGVAFAMASMVAASGSFIMVRTLRNLHFLIPNIGFAIVGLVGSLVVRYATGSYSVPNKPSETYVYVLLIAILSCASLFNLTLALKYEQAGPVSVVRSMEVIFSFLFQMISGRYPDYIAILGTTLVLSSVGLLGFQKYIKSLDASHNLRRKLWFVLK